MIRHIIEHDSERKKVSELEEELKRKQEVVSRDANILEKYSPVRKIRERQAVYLKALYGSLKIELAKN